MFNKKGSAMKLTLTAITTLFLLVACAPRSPLPVVQIPQPIVQEVKVPTTPPPLPPKKDMQLKEVKDTNYSDTYMYPEDGAAAKKDPVVEAPVTAPASGMTKEACISMISQEKFDKYTAMFGSEEASIKRCAMIKAMGQ